MALQLTSLGDCNKKSISLLGRTTFHSGTSKGSHDSVSGSQALELVVFLLLTVAIIYFSAFPSLVLKIDILSSVVLPCKCESGNQKSSV